MGVTHDQAICLRHREWSETSQTVVLLTERHGLVRGLAKGSRRERAVFSGGFELLQLGEVGLILKADTELALLTEWDLHNPFLALRADHRAAVLGMVAAELTASALAPRDPHPGVFRALAAMLPRLPEPGADAAHGFAVYLAALLADSGQWPELDHGDDADVGVEAPPLGFDPARGRVVTDLTGVFTSTDPFEAGARHDAVWPIRSRTLDYLATLPEPGAAPSDRRDSARGARFLTAWLAYRTGRQPQSLRAFLRVTEEAKPRPGSGSGRA